ncbi:hypothetical protein [Paraburkholderia acidiphila]|uniref:hypothetical protein n=1 Tax=Paraburkholderia acidiphila TaxID=2571747 RepID=UPI0018EF3391|nr:hypothetical protein [Paraburkholderia acidiphila]
MDDAERLRLYQGMAEVSRKWVTTLDAKAGFIAAINAALLGFIWTTTKLPTAAASTPWPHRLGFFATGLSLISLCLAMVVVVPRIRLSSAPPTREPNSKPSVEAVTFYGFVAAKYPASRATQFAEDVLQMPDSDLAREALEQHHAICHVAHTKNCNVSWAGFFWFAAMMATILGIASSVAG